MPTTLHENRTHGTTTFPLQVYSHHDKDGFYSVSPHWHEELEWIYVEIGVLDLTVHGKHYTLCAGEFCFINSGELHEISSVGESLHHAIVFQANFLNFSLYDTCEHQFIRPVTSHLLAFPTLGSCLPPQTAQQILEQLQKIVQCYHAKTYCYSLQIKISILQVLELLYQANVLTQTVSSAKEANMLDKFKQVICYMQDHYTQPLSLQELAELACLSPSYFCHTFRKETGSSPITFLNAYRIERAAQILSESDMPISQVATTVGFDNFSYFIRKFRERKGVSPREYRRQIQSS